ncbi:MAG TPA: alpha/beta hydrolase [Sphingomonas sp.]
MPQPIEAESRIAIAAPPERERSEPRRRFVDAGPVRIAVHEWGDAFRGRGPTILLCHATGFHARCWDAVIARLPGFHILALDLRGHGASDSAPIETWRDFGADIVRVLRVLAVDGAIGVGHSLGGHAVTVAAGLAPALFDRLILVDPVILPPDFYRRGHNPMAAPLSGPHPAARRRRSFASAREMYDLLSPRSPYAVFERRVMEDYCRHALVPAASGDGLELCCAPEFEASVYMLGVSNTRIHETVRTIACPVTVMRGMEPRGDEDRASFLFSPTWPGLAAAFPRGADVPLPGLTHFIPMQAPAETARIILAAIGGTEAGQREA